MNIFKNALSRRTLLRGTGAAFALPLLDAMVPAMTARAASPATNEQLRRIGYIYIPMGCNPKEWIPTGDTLDVLPSSLSPLKDLKDHVSVLSGLDLQNAYPGSHATSNSAFRPTGKC